MESNSNYVFSEEFRKALDSCEIMFFDSYGSEYSFPEKATKYGYSNICYMHISKHASECALSCVTEIKNLYDEPITIPNKPGFYIFDISENAFINVDSYLERLKAAFDQDNSKVAKIMVHAFGINKEIEHIKEIKEQANYFIINKALDPIFAEFIS